MDPAEVDCRSVPSSIPSSSRRIIGEGVAPVHAVRFYVRTPVPHRGKWRGIVTSRRGPPSHCSAIKVGSVQKRCSTSDRRAGVSPRSQEVSRRTGDRPWTLEDRAVNGVRRAVWRVQTMTPPVEGFRHGGSGRPWCHRIQTPHQRRTYVGRSATSTSAESKSITSDYRRSTATWSRRPPVTEHCHLIQFQSTPSNLPHTCADGGRSAGSRRVAAPRAPHLDGVRRRPWLGSLTWDKEPPQGPPATVDGDRPDVRRAGHQY
jgi:hypothetical protein